MSASTVEVRLSPAFPGCRHCGNDLPEYHFVLGSLARSGDESIPGDAFCSPECLHGYLNAEYPLSTQEAQLDRAES